MNVLLLLIFSFLQFPQDNQIIIGPTDYEHIHFNEIVNNKIYVDAIMVDGKRIQVPVINGFVPRVLTTPLTTGGYKRDFYYDDKTKYEGQSLLKYSLNKKSDIKPEIVEPKKEPKSDSKPMQELLKKRDQEVYELKQIVEKLQKEIDVLKTENRKLREPQPEQKINVKLPNSSMKRPSEVLK